MIRRILTLPRDKRTLRTPCSEVRPTDEWPEVLADLRDTLNATPNAAGLAAPQIGSLLRIFVVRDGPRILEFINPRIVGHGQERETEREGCLSMPGFVTSVERWTSVVVDATGLGRKEFWPRFSGHIARVVQHELDHLDGILLSQREAEANAAKHRFPVATVTRAVDIATREVKA